MIFNLNEIKNLYPEAYKIYISKYYYNFMNFFDEQGFYIVIIPEFYKNSINWNLQVFWYDDGNIYGTYSYGDNNEFKNRIEAENAAFILSFELLNRKLSGFDILPDFISNERFVLNFNRLLCED
jgi:hypothetical protein